MRVCPQCGNRFVNDEAFCPNDGLPTTVMAAVTPSLDPLLGTTVDGRYRIEKKIGEGGMGVVYQATHIVLGKKQCLKILRGDMAKDQDVVQRFIQEAQVASSIGHENIVEISDFGRLPDGAVYFVMELLEGEALTDLIKRGGSVPMQEALRIVRQIASALGAAHARGITHRDLKPDNVFLTHRGDGQTFVKVLDFGIAKVQGANSKLTRTGTVFGTPHYMSPEQAAGQSVDQRTDIYALGVIMYEMFTGKVPFDADTFMGILTKHMFEPPVPPSQLAGGVARLGALEDITLKALAKKPEHRYQTMDEVVGDLDRVQSGGNISIGAKAGMPAPGGLADALEPPSRTEMRLGRGPVGTVETTLPKNKAPLVVLGLLGAFVVIGGLIVAVVVLRGMMTTTTPPIAGASTTTPVVGAGGSAGAGATGSPTKIAAGGAGSTGAAAGGLHPVASPPPGVGTDVQPAAGGTPTVGAAAGSPTADVQRVQLVSTPPGAQVLFNGAMLGVTPLQVARPTQGERELSVRLAGFREQRVVLMQDSPASIPLALEAERVAHAGTRRTGPAVTPPAGGTHERGAETPPATGTSGRTGMSTNEVVDPWGR